MQKNNDVRILKKYVICQFNYGKVRLMRLSTFNLFSRFTKLITTAHAFDAVSRDQAKLDALRFIQSTPRSYCYYVFALSLEHFYYSVSLITGDTVVTRRPWLWVLLGLHVSTGRHVLAVSKSHAKALLQCSR